MNKWWYFSAPSSGGEYDWLTHSNNLSTLRSSLHLPVNQTASPKRNIIAFSPEQVTICYSNQFRIKRDGKKKEEKKKKKETKKQRNLNGIFNGSRFFTFKLLTKNRLSEWIKRLRWHVVALLVDLPVDIESFIPTLGCDFESLTTVKVGSSSFLQWFIHTLLDYSNSQEFSFFSIEWFHQISIGWLTAG